MKQSLSQVFQIGALVALLVFNSSCGESGKLSGSTEEASVPTASEPDSGDDIPLDSGGNEVNSRWELDLARTNWLNNPGLIVNSGQLQVKTNFETPDNFQSGIGNWTTYVSGAADIAIQTQNGRMNFDCNAGWAGTYFNLKDYQDYIAYYEMTVTLFDDGQNVIPMTGRVVDAGNLAEAGVWSNDYRLHVRANDVRTELLRVDQVAATNTLNTKYAVKAKFEGQNMAFKYWNLTAGEPEPVDYLFNASSDLLPTAGKLGLSCFSSEGYWENLKVYPVDATTEYPMNPISIVTPPITGNISSWSSLDIATTIGPNEDIRFEVSLDQGSTYLTYANGAWIESISGFSTALSTTQLQQSFSQLPAASQLQFKIYFKSGNGSSTPELTQLVMNYVELK